MIFGNVRNLDACILGIMAPVCLVLLTVAVLLMGGSTESAADPVNGEIHIDDNIAVVSDVQVQFTFNSSDEGYYMICLEDISVNPRFINVISDFGNESFINNWSSVSDFAFYSPANTPNKIAFIPNSYAPMDFVFSIVKPSIVDLTLDSITIIDDEIPILYRFTAPDDDVYMILPVDRDFTGLQLYQENHKVGDVQYNLIVQPEKGQSSYVVSGKYAFGETGRLTVSKYVESGTFSNSIEYHEITDDTVRIFDFYVTPSSSGFFKSIIKDSNRLFLLTDSQGTIYGNPAYQKMTYYNLSSQHYKAILINGGDGFDLHIAKTTEVQLQSGNTYTGTFDEDIVYRYTATSNGCVGLYMDGGDANCLYARVGNAGCSGLRDWITQANDGDECYVWIIGQSLSNYKLNFVFDSSIQLDDELCANGHLSMNDIDSYKFSVAETSTYSMHFNAKYVNCTIIEDDKNQHRVYDGYFGRNTPTIIKLDENTTYTLCVQALYYEQDYSFEIKPVDSAIVEPGMVVHPPASDTLVYVYSSLEPGTYYLNTSSDLYTSIYYKVGSRTSQIGGSGTYGEVIRVQSGQTVEVLVPEIEHNVDGISFVLCQENLVTLDIAETYSGVTDNVQTVFSIPSNTVGWFSIECDCSDTHTLVLTRNDSSYQRISSYTTPTSIYLPGGESVKLILLALPGTQYSLCVDYPDYMTISEGQSFPIIKGHQNLFEFIPEHDGFYSLDIIGTEINGEICILDENGSISWPIASYYEYYRAIIRGSAGNPCLFEFLPFNDGLTNCELSISNIVADTIQEGDLKELLPDDDRALLFIPSSSGNYVFSCQGQGTNVQIVKNDKYITSTSGNNGVAAISMIAGQEYILFAHANNGGSVAISKVVPLDIGSSSSFIGTIGTTPKVLKYTSDSDSIKDIKTSSENPLKIRILDGTRLLAPPSYFTKGSEYLFVISGEPGSQFEFELVDPTIAPVLKDVIFSAEVQKGESEYFSFTPNETGLYVFNPIRSTGYGYIQIVYPDTQHQDSFEMIRPYIVALTSGTEYVFKLWSDYTIEADMIVSSSNAGVLDEGIESECSIQYSAYYEFVAPSSGTYTMTVVSDSYVSLCTYSDGYVHNNIYGYNPSMIIDLDKNVASSFTLSFNDTKTHSANILIERLGSRPYFDHIVSKTLSETISDVYFCNYSDSEFDVLFSADNDISVTIVDKKNFQRSYWSGRNNSGTYESRSDAGFYVMVSGAIGTKYTLSIKPISYEAIAVGDDGIIDIMRGETDHFSFIPDESGSYVIHTIGCTAGINLTVEDSTSKSYSYSDSFDDCRILLEAIGGKRYIINAQTWEGPCQGIIRVSPAEIIDVNHGINNLSSAASNVYRYSSDTDALALITGYDEAYRLAYRSISGNLVEHREGTGMNVIGSTSSEDVIFWIETRDSSTASIEFNLIPLEISVLNDGENHVSLENGIGLFAIDSTDRVDRTINISSSDSVQWIMMDADFYKSWEQGYYVMVNNWTDLRYVLILSEVETNVLITISKVQTLRIGDSFDWSSDDIRAIAFEFESNSSIYSISVETDVRSNLVWRLNGTTYYSKSGNYEIFHDSEPNTLNTMIVALEKNSRLSVSLENMSKKTVEIVNGDDSVLCFILRDDTARFIGYHGTETVSIPEFIFHDGSRYEVTGIATIHWEHPFVADDNLREVTVPSSFSSIEQYLFWGCSSLIKVNLPNSVEEIGSYAFYGCSSLEEIIIPDGVVYVDEYAFAGCSSLESVSIAFGTTVHKDAFSGIVFVSEQSEVLSADQIPGYRYVRHGEYMVRDSPYSGHATLSSNDIVTSGHEVSFSVSIADVAAKSLSIKVLFDPEVFEYIEGSWLIDGVIRSIDANHHAVIAWEDPFSLDGEVLTFKLRAKCTAETTTVRCEVMMDSGHVDLGTVSKTLSVIEYIPGDVDGDGEVTSDDAIYLLYNTFDPIGHPIDQWTDYDRDGEVTSDDAIYLLYHTFNPSDYPLLRGLAGNRWAGPIRPCPRAWAKPLPLNLMRFHRAFSRIA